MPTTTMQSKQTIFRGFYFLKKRYGNQYLHSVLMSFIKRRSSELTKIQPKYYNGSKKKSILFWLSCRSARAATPNDLQDIKLLNIDAVEWMREKYRKVIYTFCYFLKNPSTYDLTGNAFTVLQSRNPENYKYLDLNRQANVRSGIC